MRFHALLLLAGTASAALMTACNANNCLRQVRATNSPTRSADCAAYQTTVVQPYVTVTVYGPSFVPAPTPTGAAAVKTIPKYASSCTNDAAYRSACSCIGSTSSSGVIASTSTVTATSPCATIALRATAGAFAGMYFAKIPEDGNIEQLVSPNAAGASQLNFRNGRFYEVGGGTNALNSLPSSQNYVFLDGGYVEDPNASADTYRPLNCAVGANGAVSCQAQDGTNNMFLYTADKSDSYVGFATNAAAGYVMFVPQAICVA